jgi:hypothetical protein
MMLCPYETDQAPDHKPVWRPVGGEHPHPARIGRYPDLGPAMVCGGCGRCARCGKVIER